MDYGSDVFLTIQIPVGGESISLKANPSSIFLFKLDPAEVSFAQDGLDLVANCPDGKIVLSDFFLLKAKELPHFILEDGSKLSALDLLEPSGLLKINYPEYFNELANTLTIDQEGSGTNYQDNPGDLINGVERLSDLDPFYWGRDREIIKDFDGIRGANFSVKGDAISEIDFLRVGISLYGEVAEGGHPNKNTEPELTQNDGEFMRLNFKISGLGEDIYVRGIKFSNIPQGEFRIGDAENGKILVPDKTGSLSLTYEDYEKPLYFRPSNAYEDGKLSFDIALDLVGENGKAHRLMHKGEIVIRPVADMPEIQDSNTLDYALDKAVTTDFDPGSGFWKLEQKLSPQNTVSELSFEARVSFKDLDSSEKQYLLVEKQPGMQDDIYPVVSADDLKLLASMPGGKVFSEGRSYYKIDLSQEIQSFTQSAACQKALANGATEYSFKKITAYFEDGEIKSLSIGKSVSIPVDTKGFSVENLGFQIGALSEETGASGVNPRPEEKFAFSFASKISPISSSLNIEAGWTYEGNKISEELPAGLEASSNLDKGAPIKVSIDGGNGAEGAPNAPEYIDELLIRLPDEALGNYDLYFRGQALVAQNGEYKINLSQDKIQSLGDELYLKAREGSFSGDDLELDYKITVKNSQGSQAKFTGSIMVGVDSVADMPEVQVHDTKFEGDYSAFAPGTLSFKTDFDFSDIDGSEDHYILLESNPDTPLAYIKAAFVSFEIAEDGTYKKFRKDVLEEERSLDDPDAELTLSNGFYTLKLPSEIRTHNVELGLRVNPEKDSDYSLKIGARAVEKNLAGDHDYDSSNNQAELWGSLNFKVNPAEELNLETKGLYEDGQRYQYLGQEGMPEYGEIVFSADENASSPDLVHSASIFFEGKIQEKDGEVWLWEKSGTENDAYTSIGRLFSDTADIKYTNLEDGSVRIDITPHELAKDLKVDFIPSKDMSGDFKFSYESTSIDPSSGHKALSTGNGSLSLSPVADKPKADASNAEVLYKDDYTAAAPGEALSVKGIELSFSDYNDGSEGHYFVVEKQTKGSGGVKIDLVENQIIVIKGQGADGEYTQTISLNNGKASSINLTGPDGSTIDINMGQFSGSVLKDLEGANLKYQSGSFSGFKVPVANELLQKSGGVVEAEIAIKTGTGIRTDKALNLSVGAYAQEGTAPDGNEELFSYTATETKVYIGTVESQPRLGLINGHIFENDTPNAHKGTEVQKISETLLVFSGLKGGERAHMSLDFSSPDPLNPKVMLNNFESHDANDVMRLELSDAYGNRIIVDGEPVSYKIRNVDGNWIAGTGEGESWTPGIEVTGVEPQYFIFKPGYNYNSHDIKISYTMTVEDLSSGATKVWTTDSKSAGSDTSSTSYNQHPLDITVDAVAQMPVLGSAHISGGKEKEDGSFYREAEPGDYANINIDVKFEDYGESSTELHYVFIEAKAGWSAPDKFYIRPADGSEPVEIKDFSLYVNKLEYAAGKHGVFYCLEIPNSYIRDYGDNGQINVDLAAKSPKSTGEISTTFLYGAMSFEDIASSPAYRAGRDREITELNNKAIDLDEMKYVQLDFYELGGKKLEHGFVYENNQL